MTNIHSSLTAGKWCELTLYEQMGNIGVEIGRVIRAKKNNNEAELNNAVERTLELFDLTISDPNRRTQLKEIIRAKEMFLDSLSEKPLYQVSLAELDKYFMQFAIAARLNR